MKHRKNLVLFFLILLLPIHASAEWLSESYVCKNMKNDKAGCFNLVTSKGYSVYWGGKVTELEFIDNEFTGNVRISVSWVSDRSSYGCGDSIQFNYFSELKDMNKRSLAMRRC